MRTHSTRSLSVLRILFATVFATLTLGAASSFAQVSPTGTLTGTVLDPAKAAVVGAMITATNTATNASVSTTSGSDGRFVIANLAPGDYNVTVAKEGFKKGLFSSVKIVVGQTYNLKAALELGGASYTVTVESGAQVLETATASVTSTVQGPEITSLPFTSRDASDLAILDPGAQSAGRPRNSSFNGLPKGSINMTLDGINVQDNVLKSSDGFFTIIRPRVDDITQFSITTAANSAAQSGEGAVQINMVSKGGTNQFHGGVWEYLRNTDLNSNYYFNNLAGLPRQEVKSNQFGFKVGGPLLKDKLFFYGDLDMYKFPHSLSRSPFIPTTQTAQGVMAYNATGQAANPNAWTTCTATACTANLLQMAGANGFTSTPDSVAGPLFAAAASAATAPGVKSFASTKTPYRQQIGFLNTGTDNRYFPDIRFDYNLTKAHSVEFDYHYDSFDATPDFLNGFDATLPVAPYSRIIGGQISNRNLFVGAWRWTIANNKSNELRFGIQSAPVSFFPNLSASDYPSATTDLGSIHIRPRFSSTNSGFFGEPFHSFSTQGRNGALGQLIDNFSWTKGSHFLSFGMTATDQHFNDFFASSAVANVFLGIDATDPAAAMFTTTNLPGISASDLNAAEQIYADVTGRVQSYSGNVFLNQKTRQFQAGLPQLDRVSALEMGYYGSDSWQVRPGLTFNYGLRWEYQGIPHDELNQYFSLQGGYPSVFGVSGLNNLFKPGTLTGSVPVLALNGSGQWYNKYYKSFGPSIGLAWQPNFGASVLRKMFGGSGQTVFRGGYTISFDRPGLENFLALGPSNPGFSGRQFMNPATSGGGPGTGQFQAGTVQLSNPAAFQNVGQNPTQFTTSFTLDPLANTGIGINVYNPNLHAPYVQSWTVGIQRQVSANMAIEVRYVGNHGVGLWEQANLNETNILENNFLKEFQNARSNLVICSATSGCSTGFADAGLAGQVPLPVITEAFTGSPTGSQTNKNFKSGTFITELNNQLAGSFANSLAGSLSFMCNLAGTGASGFPAAECPGTAPPAGTAGTVPKNFFRVNPDATGGAFALYNGGQSTYNALQLVFRRRLTSGLQFEANYAFSKSLTNQYASSSSSFFQFSTLRNPGLDKGPAPFDIRHAFKMESLWELPFGPGHRLSTNNSFINELIGGWQFNAINKWQTGRVDLLTSGLGGTFNQNDGGVILSGMSANQLQSQLHVIKTPGNSTTTPPTPGQIFSFPASLIAANGTANLSVLKPCNTPGAFCNKIFVYGPQFFRADWSLAKISKITERSTFELRFDFLNAFNNADFYYGGSASAVATSTPVSSGSFGQIFDAYQDLSTTDDPGGRIIQVVARINF